MRRPTEIPDGMRPVPYGKGCVLLLTPQEVTAGIRHGKWWRRRQAMERREATSTAVPVVASPEAIRRCPVCGEAMTGRKTTGALHSRPHGERRSRCRGVRGISQGVEESWLSTSSSTWM